MKTSGIKNIKLDEISENIADAVNGKSIINIAHPDSGHDQNLIKMARTNPAHKKLVVDLANAGYHLYKYTNRTSSFLQYHTIPKVWDAIKTGELRFCEDIVFSLTPPLSELPAKKLLVVFSSMPQDIYQASLRRMFEPNFRTVAKSIPLDTAILRIADIGSVMGSFYMGNNYAPDYGQRVQRAIKLATSELSIQQEDVVLYGASKGGTGALYHGLIGNYKAVSVDPILSDEYYISRYRDSHFTIGTFPETKQEIFARLAKEITNVDGPIAIITSPRSPQYPFIVNGALSTPLSRFITEISASNSLINDHPDVSKLTLNIAVMLMNMAFYNQPFSSETLKNVV